MEAKYIILFIVGFILIAVLGFFFLGSVWGSFGRQPVVPTPAPAPPAPPAGGPPPSNAGRTPATHIISMIAAGFEPATLAVAAGDTVVFKNNDSRTRWPASNLHPTHTLCPGFDSLQPVRPSEEYSHVFTRAEECPMHDHLMPSLRGKITVTE